MPNVCHSCHRKSLRSTSRDFADLGLVTSDCRPWKNFCGSISVCTSCGLIQKKVNSEFKAETRDIYETYQSYSQSEGKEQSVFSMDGTNRKRSDKIVDYLEACVEIKSKGRLLDFGCGAGNFLRAFNLRHEAWELFGSDYGNSVREKIESIPNTSFISGPIDKADLTFDLIIASHVIEHIADPLSILSILEARLAENGRLLIQVPNVRQSPFDILIADHCSHFSIQSLTDLISRSGLSLVGLSDSVVPKEITALLGPVHGEGRSDTCSWALVDTYIDFLKRTKNSGWDNTRALGVFGSSISASWLVGQIPGIGFFVDEDPDRIGKSHLGLRIISPADIPEGAVVLLPMNPRLAERIESRLKSKNYRLVLLPAEAEDEGH